MVRRWRLNDRHGGGIAMLGPGHVPAGGPGPIEPLAARLARAIAQLSLEIGHELAPFDQPVGPTREDASQGGMEPGGAERLGDRVPGACALAPCESVGQETIGQAAQGRVSAGRGQLEVLDGAVVSAAQWARHVVSPIRFPVPRAAEPLVHHERPVLGHRLVEQVVAVFAAEPSRYGVAPPLVTELVRNVREVERLQERRLERDAPCEAHGIEAAGALRDRGWNFDDAQRRIRKRSEEALQLIQDPRRLARHHRCSNRRGERVSGDGYGGSELPGREVPRDKPQLGREGGHESSVATSLIRRSTRPYPRGDDRPSGWELEGELAPRARSRPARIPRVRTLRREHESWRHAEVGSTAGIRQRVVESQTGDGSSLTGLDRPYEVVECAVRERENRGPRRPPFVQDFNGPNRHSPPERQPQRVATRNGG